MRMYLILPVIFLLGLFPECERDSIDVIDCTTAICTMEYRSVTVLIKHKEDNSFFQLTDFKVIRVSDRKDITVNHSDIAGTSGYYTVTNDSYTGLFRNKNVEIEFIGFMNNTIVIQKRFIVTADCCHISLVEGEVLFYL